MSRAWVNGRFLALGEAGILPTDPAFLSGLGVFETLGVFDGRLPLFARHLERLAGGAERLGIDFRPPPDLEASATELLRRQPGDDILRITLSAGVGGQPTLCLTTRRRQIRAGPLRLFVSSYRRQAGDPTAAIKCCSQAFLFLAGREAKENGADEALLLEAGGEEGGRVLETATGNLFFVAKGGQFCTPGLSGALLPGVARQVLLESLAAVGTPVQEGDYYLPDIETSEAIFVSNAVHGPRPACLVRGTTEPGLKAAGAIDLVSAWERGIRTQLGP